MVGLTHTLYCQVSQHARCNILHVAIFYPIWKTFSASINHRYFLVQKEIGTRNTELKKKFVKKKLENIKNYVIETGNVCQCCSVSHITSVLFGLIRQWSAWSLKQGICCKNGGMSIFDLVLTPCSCSIFLFLTLNTLAFHFRFTHHT